MNTNHISLEMTEAGGTLPAQQEKIHPLDAGAQPEIQLPPAAARWKALVAKCLLLPAGIYASVLLVKIVVVAGDLWRILDQLYVGGQLS